MPHNIEKSAFRRGAYVGYGGGAVWHIVKDGQAWRAQPINWIAASHLPAIHGRTLTDISAKLDSFNA